MRALFSPPQAAGSRSTVDTDHRWHGGCAGVRACMARPKMAATNLLAAATKRGSCRPGDRPAVGWTSPHLLSQLAGGGRTWRARATGWYWWRPSMQSWCRRRRRPRRRPLLFVGLGWGEGKKGFAVCSGLSVMHALHDACTNARTCNHFFPLVSSHPFDNFFATPSLLGDSSSASMLPRAGLARDGKRHGLAGHGDPMGLGQRGLGWHGCRRCCWKVGGGGGSEPKQNGPGF